MKNKRNCIQCVIVVFCIILCFLYLKSKVTYSSYESVVDGNIDSSIASWNIKIDNESITTLDMNKSVGINDIKWDTTNVREGKVAPGSSGVMNINIDASETDVAVKYEMEIIDKTVDNTKFFTVTDIFSTNTNLIKTGLNKYVGILSIDDIENGIKPNIQIDMEWKTTEEIVYKDENSDDLESFIVINFVASQYNGEEIIPYVE